MILILMKPNVGSISKNLRCIFITHKWVIQLSSLCKKLDWSVLASSPTRFTMIDDQSGRSSFWLDLNKLFLLNDDIIDWSSGTYVIHLGTEYSNVDCCKQWKKSSSINNFHVCSTIFQRTCTERIDRSIGNKIRQWRCSMGDQCAGDLETSSQTIHERSSLSSSLNFAN